MGQNQSLTAKGTLNLDSTSPSASQNCNQDHAPSPNPLASAGSGSGGNPTGSNAMELQTQSVRAAIDSFIETCLAGGPEKTSCTPHRPGTERTPPPASDAEVVKIPEDDDGGDKPGDGKDRGGDENGGSGKPEVTATGGLSSDKTGDCSSETSASSTNVPADGNSSKDVKFAVDGSWVPDGRVASAQKTDEKSSANETKSVLSVNPAKSSSACVPDENSAHRSPSREGSKSKESSDASNDGEGAASVQLKTIIERVLDSSLGVGMSLKSIPLEQQILPQIAADETATSTSSKAKETESGKGRETESGKASGEGGWGRRVEPVTLCFMDHIEKAVERSFSSITEEEERKEKEKALAAAAKMTDSKAPGWNNARVSKNSEAPSPASSAADGTISVQDIVDRVISQTEVISKRGTDSKPLVAASGTFYPDRAPAQTNPQSQHRREALKEESPRESMGRRGRPRMRSPYHDHREAAVQEYLHGNAARETMAVRRVPAGVPPEDYLQSMHAAMAKYGQVHPSHGMPPFMPAGMATTASVTQGYLPASTMHGAMVAAGGGGLHPSTSALHQAQAVRGAAAPHHATAAAPHHTTAAVPHHTAAASNQPPPLLRVNPMERSERSPHQQKHPHPPSRSCGCSVCAVYFGRERDAERARMMQQSGQGERSIPRSSPHSPHHPYSNSSVAVAQAHPQRWPSVDPRHAEPKAEKMQAHHPFPYPSQSALRGHDAYPAGHPAYGIQTGVPVPQLGYVEKPLPESRHAQPPYPKAAERGGEYGHAYRPAHVGYDKAQLGEAAVGRQPYPPSMTSIKPLAGHPHPHPHTPTHTHAHMQSGRKAEDPGLDLTYRRDLATAATAAAATATAPAFGVEEDKPLDLSAKKQASPAPFQERQDTHQRLEDHRVEDGRHYAGDVMNMDRHVREVTGPDRQRDGEKFVSGSQHLHNLETSVESYFQKLQQHPGVHRVPPPQNISAGVPPQHVSMAVAPHAQGTGAGLPLQTMGAAAHPSSGPESAVPLPPHHPTHPPQHRNPAVYQGYPPASNPSPAYPPEPLLSPGGRRPQLHPIPAPNLSTSLGPTAPRPAAAFQSRGGGSTIPMAPGVPTHSVSSASNQSLPVPVSSPQTSGGGAPYSADYLRSSGSRSVSPLAGSDARGEDRRRGSVSKHEPIQNIIGNNNPQDILYLICRLCRQTYGSPYGFRKHFRNQHGFEPKAEHTFVQTISATKSARQLSGGGTPNMDSESPLQEPYLHPGNSPSVDSVGHSSHTASPRPEMVRSIADESPRSRNSDSPGDPHLGEGGAVAAQAQGYKYRGSFSRASTDSKGRSPSGSASGGSVVDEREDTKCLECPECGQAFQLNDFGSYKRHCRQHGQMRGAQGGVSQGVYTCTDCQCSFSEHQLLQEHLVRHEAHTAAVLCTVCRVPFPSPAHCQEHVRTVHGGLAAEPTSSSSSPLLVTSKARSASSAFSHSDISSTSSVKREIASTASADSSISFNLTVTTPSDLEIRRLPADHIVTSASPDSSSDNKKGQECSSVSSSEQTKTETVQTEPGSLDSPKPTSVEGSDSPKIKLESKAPVKSEEDKDSGYLDGCPSNDSRSISTEGSLASSVDMEENTELFMYKHKKFSAHRKRAGSSEGLETDVKQPRLETDAGSWEKTQQNVVSSASDKGQAKKAAASPPAVSGEEKSLAPPKPAPSKTEARHQMPFVWDRVTRSQAGKNARSSDYS